MPGEDRRTQLRLLLAQDDSDRVLDGLADEWPADALQLVGDTLLRALVGGTSRAADLARRCATELRSREWDGDAELADLLEATLGIGPIPLLRPIAVDLEELAMRLEGDPVHAGGRIDLRTGEVWPAAAIEYAQEAGELDAADDDDEDEGRWLWVPCEGSRDGYRDMELFAARIGDAGLRGRLEQELTGRGVFRRFRDVLAESPRHLQEWYAFTDERQRGRARNWLASEGYRPIP
ncbi:MAG: UPF0158 family protein [Propionibacteriaceae bacterium]